MVLGFIADVVLDVTYWTSKKVYNAGHWLVFGSPKTKTEKMLEKQNETIKELTDNVMKLNDKLEKLTVKS